MKIAYARLPISADERAEFARQGYVKIFDIRFKPKDVEPEPVTVSEPEPEVIEQPKRRGKRNGK